VDGYASLSGRELDDTTARAVALMTLYITGLDSDDRRAGALLEELLADPGGPAQAIAGFESLCGVLLALLELETGSSPECSLQRVGNLVASAVSPPGFLSS
jgi:hypothetical protein